MPEACYSHDKRSIKLLSIGSGASAGNIVAVGQFLRFGLVGLVGFVADTGVVYALKKYLGLYIAGIAAYAVAVTVTWLFNRIWTFRDSPTNEAMHRQWLRFALANTPGLVLNRSAYFVLITVSQTCRIYPVFAVAAGALAGMVANFTLTRAWIFRQPRPLLGCESTRRPTTERM